MKIEYDGMTFYYDKSNGYMFNFNKGKKTYLHRYIWEKHNGKIPYKYHVHHVDENKLNNDISNLECISISEHVRKTKYKGRLTKQEIYNIGKLHLLYNLDKTEIAKRIGRSPSTVFDVLSGRRKYERVLKCKKKD